MFIIYYFFAFKRELMLDLGTGEYLSETLILASTNPQYDDRLFIELQVQYMKISSSEHVVCINCFECQNKNNLFTHLLSLQFSCTELVTQ